MRRTLALLGLLAALSYPSPASSASLVLDTMTDPFTPNTCLTNSAQPAIFYGTLCDGDACPPAPVVSSGSSACYQVAQHGLPGVIGGKRSAVVLDWYDLGDSTVARLLPGAGAIAVTTSERVTGGLELWYDGGRENTWDWNLDLSATPAFSVTLAGEIDPVHPVHCVLVLSNWVSSWVRARVEIEVTQPGNAVLPLSQLTADPGFDLHSVDVVEIYTSNCTPGCNCDGDCEGQHPPQRYSVGPPRFDIGATPAVRGSWGRLKAIYR